MGIEHIDFFLHNTQCLHLILGVIHDTGYKPFLNEYAAEPSIQSRVTLLEGDNLNKSMRNLGFSRPLLKWDNVFARSGAAPHHHRHSPAHNAASANNRVVVVGGHDERPVSAPPHHAATHKPRDDANPPRFVNSQCRCHRLRPARDAKGERVDRSLAVDPSEPYLDALRENNLCGWYYLRGECRGACGKNHVPRPLSEHEFDRLWFLCRGGGCFKYAKGKGCDDERCIYRHCK